MSNSKKRCKECKKYFPAVGMIVVPAGRFCGHEHMMQWVKRKQAAEVEKRKAWSKSLPKNKRELDKQDKSWQIKQTQTSFNKMRVQQEKLWFYERNIEPYCISCGKPKMDFCCGHYKTRGSNSFLQFDEQNTFLQCNKYCNSSLSANINGTTHTHGYLEGLRLRFGNEEGQRIIDYCDTAPTVRDWTIDDLEAMRKHYNAEYRRLVPLVEMAKTLFYENK